MGRLLLIFNPCAGQRRANRFLPDMIRRISDSGYECTVYVTGGPGDATEYLQTRAAAFDRVICVGGDGTLNETIAGITLSGADCPIGYVPAGTTNDCAASLGLSTDIMQSVRDALEGRVYYFDLGSFNGRSFTYTATCGAFARVSYTTPQAAKNLLGHAAYILEGMRDLSTLRPIEMRLEAEDRTIEGEFILCSVTNSLSVGGVLKLDPGQVGLNDGVFEVMLVRNPTNPAQWTKILTALMSRDLPCEMIEFFPGARLKITTSVDVEWTLDGERGDCGREFVIENLPRRVPILLPERAAETVPAEPAEAQHEDQLPD